MFKYTKSLLTAAMALSCSLTLVACGGGGGGGGEDTTTNGGTTTGGTTTGGSSTDNSTTVKDYAPNSITSTIKLQGGSDFFVLYSGGSCRYGMTSSVAYRFDGVWRYTKTGTNTATLNCTRLSSDFITYNYYGTLTFYSDDTVHYEGSWDSVSYTGKTGGGSFSKTYTIEK